jgi:hypothetical protein
MVEGIEELSTEVHRSGLGDFCILRDGQVPVLLKRAAERVAAHISYRRARGRGVWRAIDLAGHHNILVIHAVTARRESVQVKVRTKATRYATRGNGRSQGCARRKGGKVCAVNAFEVLKAECRAIKYWEFTLLL